MPPKRYRGPERRNFMRLEADCAIDYLKLSRDLKPVKELIDNSYSSNISATGVKFHVSEDIPVGTFLELHIKIPTVNKFITAVAKVVRCDKEGKDKYGAAISFIWISKKDKGLIDDYVRMKKLEKLRSEMKE